MRFIPTYVGHTVSVYSHVESLPVHPHLCGAYAAADGPRKLHHGSSPHTWGILAAPYIQVLRHRFIPTYVGHTWADLLKFMSRTVHPHIRGAYTRKPLSGPLWVGSSPHTWGIRRSAAHSAPAFPVHPHIRRAYNSASRSSTVMCGSSPHTWGIPYIRPFGCSHPRFIPTYVGHTLDRRKKNGWFQPLLL